MGVPKGDEAAGGAAAVALRGGLSPTDLFNRGEISPVLFGAVCATNTQCAAAGGCGVSL